MGIQTKILTGLRSPKFFWGIIALFVLQASWIAISAAYPMVFDENTHFGLIKLHATQWSPVFTHQPANADFAGAVTRDPSYLYHYLLSFPYRLLVHLTSDQMVQIIGLRFINILFFGLALILFRKVLLKTSVSPAIVHVILLFFVLVPVVPLLAGQINYDNLVMLVTGLSLLLTIEFVTRLRQHNSVPFGRLFVLLAVCMLGSLVQYEFLPIAVALILYSGWQIYRQKKLFQLNVLRSIRESWQGSNWLHKLIAGVPFVIALALFVQMYGVNVVVYKNPLPPCDHVLSAQQCAAYAPWARNHAAGLHKQAVNPNPVLYAASWVYRMFVAMFYTSSGGAGPTANYLSINPLPVVFITALVVFAFGCVAFLRHGRTILRRYHWLGFLTFVAVFYTANLWLHNYQDFVSLGQKVAINGRYIFPVALLLMLLFALCCVELLASWRHMHMALAGLILLLFLQGGGILTYVTVSKPTWYWHNQFVIQLNARAQRTVSRLIVMKTPVPSINP